MNRLATVTILAMASAAQAVPTNSGTVTTEPGNPPLTPAAVTAWKVVLGAGTISPTTVTTPDGSSAIQATATAPGVLQVDNTLTTPLDVRSYDTFSFWTLASATHVGDLAYLVDTLGRRRWYSLVLLSGRGWERPTYWIDSFVGQDAGFNPGAIAKIRLGQSGQAVNDKLSFGPTLFEHNMVNHGDASSSWFVDIGGPGSTIATVTDGANGTPTSMKASVVAVNGQSDVAINLVSPRITWDWSGKSFVSFYYKDNEPTMNHYFLVYDKNIVYRQWIFTNPTPGQWFRVTANLSDASYVQSGPVDLSHIVYFEVGVFGGTAAKNATHIFQVDEVSVY
jgi:hypothetical protein